MSPELTRFLADVAYFAVVLGGGAMIGRHLSVRHLTGHPCLRTGVCGPYELEGRFYYVVPQGQWERLRTSVLGLMEYDS